MYCEYDPQKLLVACRHHKNVYCYGAGTYGRTVVSFLRGNNISVKSFFTTNDEKVGMEGIPVRKFANVMQEELVDSLIILSLGAIHHKKVTELIFSRCASVEIFPIDSVLIEIIITFINKDVLIQRIMDCGGVLSHYNEQYEEKFRSLYERYPKIILRNIDLTTIGFITTSWIYYNEIIHPKDEYWAFYPCPTATINDFLVGKLQKENIEIIWGNAIKFWKYVLLHYRERIEIKTLSSRFGLIQRENQWFSKHSIPPDKKYVSFTQKEMNQGLKFLKEHNINELVCVFARDSTYLSAVRKMHDRAVEIMNIYRNISISSFSQTAQYLQQNKLTPVRMGHMVDSLADDNNIFDYGHDYRSEFLDIFLFAQCKFFIGTPSGIQYIANLFSKPLLMINVPVLSTLNDVTFINGKYNLMILQKYLDTRDNHYLTLREMLTYEMSENDVDNHNIPIRTLTTYEKNKIIPIKNTAEEIASATKEMIYILNGTVKYDSTDIRLQEKFKNILDEFKGSKNFLFQYKIGSDFLRKNQWMLE